MPWLVRAASISAVLLLFGTSRSLSQEPIIKYFQLGESQITSTEEPSFTVLPVDTRPEVNAFSVLQLRLTAGGDLSGLFSLEYNLLITVDLQKSGEDTWSRVIFTDALSRQIVRSSFEHAATDTLQHSFFVNDQILDRSPYLGEGESALVLYLYDLTSTKRHNDFLLRLHSLNEPLFSLNLQRLYLQEPGAVPVPYTAKDGDELRIQFLRAGYQEDRRIDVSTLATMDEKERKLIKALSQYVRKATGKQEPNSPQDVLTAIEGLVKSKAIEKDSWTSVYEHMDPKESQLVTYVLQNKADWEKWRIGDLVNPLAEAHLDVKEFGIKLNVSPVIALGTDRADPDPDDLNPIKTNPSVGSNIYFSYDGRNKRKEILNWIPGINMSLLSVGDKEAQFTLGFSYSLLPSLRDKVSVFFAWRDLRHPVMGLTFSPDINFRAMVGAEKNSN